MHSHNVTAERIPILRKGGVTAVFNCQSYEEYSGGSVEEYESSIYRYDGFAKRALKDLDALFSEFEKGCVDMVLALKADDIKEAKKRGKIAMILAFEGAKSLEGTLYLLRTYYRLGFRLIQFNHNYRNQLSDGCVERNAAGLTNFGVDVVREMNKLGMLIDLMHLAEPGFLDVLELTNDPVIVSHVGSRTIRNVKQNLTDNMIKAVAENGGVIGTVFSPLLVKKDLPMTINDILDHIDYFVKVAGIDHIAIGTDFPGSCARIKLRGHRREQHLAMLRHFNKIRPEDYQRVTITPPPEGTENMWADLPNVTRGLVARGYSDEEIKKILGGNILRVFAKVVD